MAPAKEPVLKPLDTWFAERLRQGPLPVSDVMGQALYHPRHGYYRRNEGRWGFEGADYFTALDCGPLLGEALAERFQSAWKQMGRPPVFTVLEAGAGRGWLGRDLLSAAREPFASALRYVHRDDHPAGLKAAAEALAPWIGNGRARFCPESERPQPFVGAILSNELFDALPTQPWRWDGGRWTREVLTLEGPAWEPAEAGEAGAWFESQAEGGLHPGDGSTWCEGLPLQVEELCGALREGLFLAIDYGDTASRLLAKGAGLRRYRNHGTDERWWEDLGQADLTADVDFTRLAHILEKQGPRGGREASLGAWIREHAPLRELEARWEALPAGERAKAMENLLQLALPERMGGRFRVLEAWKGQGPPSEAADPK